MSDGGRAARDPEASGRLLFAAALVAGALLRLILLGEPDLFGADEGSWAVAARNLTEAGTSQFVALSGRPLGEPSGTPILFPSILAGMVRVFGPEEWAIRLPSAAAGLFGAFVLERIVRRGWGQPAGHLAGAFAAIFPPLVSASRDATVEPTLVALGLAGIIFGLRAFEEDSPADAAAAGLFFGLGFLAKGYAVGLFLAPLLVSLALRPRLFGLGGTTKRLLLLLSVFVLVGGSYLLLVAVVRPASFGFLLATAFGLSEASARAAAGATAFGSDLKTIVKTLFFFLPLVGVGAAFLSRPLGEAEVVSGATEEERRLDHGALWGIYGIELLLQVIVSGRLKLSSIPVMPALAAFAGLGGAALLAPSGSRRRIRSEAGVAVGSGALVAAVAGFLMAAPTDPLFGGRTAPGTSGSALGAIGLCAVAAALLAAGFGASRLKGRLGDAFLVVLLAAGGIEAAWAVRHDLLTHRTGLREAAAQMAPDVAALPPQTFCFRAPEPEGIEFRLFRTGRSWEDVPSAEFLAREAERQPIRFWAYREGDPPGVSAPPPDVRRWLAGHAREQTAEVNARAGQVTGLRLFVPESR